MKSAQLLAECDFCSNSVQISEHVIIHGGTYWTEYTFQSAKITAESWHYLSQRRVNKSPCCCATFYSM